MSGPRLIGKTHHMSRQVTNSFLQDLSEIRRVHNYSEVPLIKRKVLRIALRFHNELSLFDGFQN